MRKYKKIVKLSPAISSKNLGDYIIDDYCNQIIEELFPDSFCINIPTHEHFSNLGRTHIAMADYSLVCGTNLLTSHMRKYAQWNLSLKDVFKVWLEDVPRRKYFDKAFLKEHFDKNKVTLLGAGWWQYQDKPDQYTTTILKMILSSQGLHSVRDSYTEQMLRSIGIYNVLNTACPTMWGLTQAHCSQIPVGKSKNVITTLTDYNINNECDDQLIEILLSNYENVFVWLQAIEDYDQVANSKYCYEVQIVPPTLKKYDEILGEMDVDYVGTRLHGGIRSLNKKHRSLIVAVDNRAVEIAKDTGLPVIKREEIAEKLNGIINSEYATEIRLPEENIKKWKAQFFSENV